MSRKLLLADDSVTIQRVVELTFSGEDIQVVSVSDGEQAIARITADPPDIVLADIAMPKKTGYEVAAFIKEHPTLSHVPVLLLAGAFEPVDEERARKVKSDGVLVKPFETHEVINRVRELIDAARAPQRPPAVPATPPVESVPAAPPVEAVLATPPVAAAPVPPEKPVAAAPVPASAPAPPVAEAPPAPPVAETPVPAPPVTRPPVPAPAFASPAATAPGDESLDEYFDRLDVAFQQRVQTPPRPFPHLAPPSHEAAAQSPVFAASEPGFDTDQRNIIADLFKAFLDVEQGTREAASIHIPDEIDRLRRRNRIE